LRDAALTAAATPQGKGGDVGGSANTETIANAVAGLIS